MEKPTTQPPATPPPDAANADRDKAFAAWEKAIANMRGSTNDQ